jgi:hypothetical protein
MRLLSLIVLSRIIKSHPQRCDALDWRVPYIVPLLTSSGVIVTPPIVAHGKIAMMH